MSANGQLERGRSSGRPRSEAARRAILRAALDLVLEHGLAQMTMDQVAARAGVSKATIYRWWRSKPELTLDALYADWESVRPLPRETGTLRGDLLALIRPWIRLVTSTGSSRVLAALINEAQRDPYFAARYRARLVQPRRDRAQAIFEAAIERDELPPGTNLELAVDLLYGPLYHRLLHRHAALDERFAAEVVDTVVAGLAAHRVAHRQPGSAPASPRTVGRATPPGQHGRGHGPGHDES